MLLNSHWVCRGKILLRVLWIWLLEFCRSLPPTSYWVWTSCTSTTCRSVGLETPFNLYLILVLSLLMLARYWVKFVQVLFLPALGSANFVLNLIRIAFWRWCTLVTVKRRGKMVLIRNMLGYVTNLPTCLSSLG